MLVLGKRVSLMGRGEHPACLRTGGCVYLSAVDLSVLMISLRGEERVQIECLR